MLWLASCHDYQTINYIPEYLLLSLVFHHHFLHFSEGFLLYFLLIMALFIFFMEEAFFLWLFYLFLLKKPFVLKLFNKFGSLHYFTSLA